MILIEDMNDNAPVITKPDQVICSKGRTRGSIVLEAKDLDQKPYSDPFIFGLGKTATSSKQWKLSSTTGMSGGQARLCRAVLVHYRYR